MTSLPRFVSFLSLFFLLHCNDGYPQVLKSPEGKFAKSLDSLILAIPTPFNGNVLAASQGSIVFKKCYGYANFESHAALNDSSIFELASLSKPFTAMGIMILKEKGKLNYDDDVRKYFPQFPYANVTVRHLLNHTSGIPDFNDDYEKRFPVVKILHNDDILRMLVEQHPPLLFKPGDKFEYSNTNYVLLALLIEKISGIGYNPFMANEIFGPARMPHSRIYNTRREKQELIPNYAFGYVYSDSLGKFILPDLDSRVATYVYMMDGVVGDGGVNSTVMDLFRWNQALDSNTLVGQSTLQEAFSPAKLNNGETTPYGFGWAIEHKPVIGKIIYHSGGHPGYGTFMIRFSDLNSCVIILSNNSGRGTKNLIKNILKLYENNIINTK